MSCRKDINKQKEAGIGPFKKTKKFFVANILNLCYCSKSHIANRMRQWTSKRKNENVIKLVVNIFFKKSCKTFRFRRDVIKETNLDQNSNNYYSNYLPSTYLGRFFQASGTSVGKNTKATKDLY